MPVTRPVVEPIVACPVLLLVQVPPAVASDKVAVEPIQTVVEPVMAAGNGFTVTTAVASEPHGLVMV